MPYADPAEQAEFNRNLYYTRYQSDPEFREAEALRKKQWYDRNKWKICARYRVKRKKIRATQQAIAQGKPIHAADAPNFALTEKTEALF